MKIKSLVPYVFIGLSWLLPITRGGRLLVYTSDEYNDCRSINASNDYQYAQMLMVSYFVGLSVSTYLVWLLNQTKSRLIWLLIICAAAGIAGIIRLKPEEVIVIFPAINPLLPSVIFLILGTLGIFIHWSYLYCMQTAKHEVSA